MTYELSINKINTFSENLANARKQNLIIEPIPNNICKNSKLVKKIRSLAEKKLKWQPYGFKIGATNKKISKVLKAKEPFYSYLFKETFFKNHSKLKLTKNTLGIELEIAYKISRKIFKKKIKNKSQLKQFIFGLAPAIELVGFRQNLRNIKYAGQAAIDFGLNISFVKSKIYKEKNILNFSSKTELVNLNTKKIYNGHSNQVMNNPINSLFWLIKKLQKQNISLSEDFWVSTGTTTPIIPVKKGDHFMGKINKIVKKVYVKF